MSVRCLQKLLDQSQKLRYQTTQDTKNLKCFFHISMLFLSLCNLQLKLEDIVSKTDLNQKNSIYSN